MSARLLAGAGAVLRREGLVRALDAAARRPLGDPGAVLGFVAVLVPRRGILAPVGLGRHLGLEERVHTFRLGFTALRARRHAFFCSTIVDPFFDDLFNEEC